jgi:ketosteroid isomerase-like protein
MTTASPRQTVERLLNAAVSPTPADMADCYADQVIIEMPFSGGLAPARTETTSEQLRERFAASAAVRRNTNVHGVRIHETTDPDVLVVEYGLEGTALGDEAPFALDYVMVMTFRDGLIVHSRDYADPIAGARALGRLPQLVAALTDDTAQVAP